MLVHLKITNTPFTGGIVVRGEQTVMQMKFLRDHSDMS